MTFAAFMAVAVPLIAALAPVFGRYLLQRLEDRRDPVKVAAKERGNEEQELIRQIEKRDDAAMSADLEEDLRKIFTTKNTK